MLQKLKTLNMALIRRDVASDIVVCGEKKTKSKNNLTRKLTSELSMFAHLTGNFEKQTSREAKGSMEKNFAVHNSKLRPKQLKKAQSSTAELGPNQMIVTPYVHSVATSSSSTLLCFLPR